MPSLSPFSNAVAPRTLRGWPEGPRKGDEGMSDGEKPDDEGMSDGEEPDDEDMGQKEPGQQHGKFDVLLPESMVDDEESDDEGDD